MLSQAEVHDVDGTTVVITHHSAPLRQRIAEDANRSHLQVAIGDILGGTWVVRMHDPSQPALSQPAPDESALDESALDGEPYPLWRDSQRCLDLEAVISLAPEDICEKASSFDPHNDAASAFWAVHHSTRCALNAPCRAILQACDDDHFDHAIRIAENLVLR